MKLKMSFVRTIRDRLARKDRFTLAEVHCWMTDENNLATWSAVYDVLGRGFYRIKPEPDMDETCEFITRYLLRCIHENPSISEDDLPTGYDAAYDLAKCLKLWASKLPETRPVLSATAKKITQAYLDADEPARDRILNGMLEHALECIAVRPFFKH